MDEIVFEYAEPLTAPGLVCEHCSEPIEAFGRIDIPGSYGLNGVEPHAYRHVANKSEVCVRTYRVQPYDGFAASRAIKEAQRVEAVNTDG